MGRPKEFDREQVLERALERFRCGGYEATSVQDLVEATGVNRFSLYDTFGDKHRLFLEVLDRYQRDRREQAIALFRQPGPKLDLVRRYFDRILESGRDGQQPGCLMVNSVVELARSDAEVAKRATEHFAQLEEIFLEVLQQARAQGEIGTDRDLRAIARFLINTARGLRVILQYTADPSVFDDIVGTALSVLHSTTVV